MPVKNPRDGWQTQKQTKLNQRQIKHRNISKINNKKKKQYARLKWIISPNVPRKMHEFGLCPLPFSPRRAAKHNGSIAGDLRCHGGKKNTCANEIV